MNAIELIRKRKQDAKDYKTFLDDIVAKAKKYDISFMALVRDYLSYSCEMEYYQRIYRNVVEKSGKLSEEEIGCFKFFLEDDIDKRISDDWKILEKFLLATEDEYIRDEAIKILSVITSFKRLWIKSKLKKLAITKSPVYIDKNLVNAMAYVVEQQN